MAITETVRDKALPEVIRLFPDATYVEVPYDSANPYYVANESSNNRAGKLEQKYYRIQYANGAVLRQYERNGYHDSDFYLVVYVASRDCTATYEYTSTRFGGSGIFGMGVSYTVDATDEVRALVKALEERKAAEELEESIALMVSQGANPESARLFHEKLKDFKGSARYADVKALLCVKKFRSEFRKSLRDQVEAWLREDSPKHQFPLSPKQTTYLSPRRF